MEENRSLVFRPRGVKKGGRMAKGLFKCTVGLLFLLLTMVIPLQSQTIGSLIFEDDFTASSLNVTYWDPFIPDNAAKGWPWNTVRGQPTNSSSIGRGGGFISIMICRPSSALERVLR